MKTLQYFLLPALIISFDCYSQTRILTIDSKLDALHNTEVCTEFQIFHCIEKITTEISSDTQKIKLYSLTASTFDDLTLSIVENSNKFVAGKRIKGLIEVEFQEIYIDKKGERTETGTIKFSRHFVAKIK